MAALGSDVLVVTGFPFAPYWARWQDKGRGLIAAEVRNRVRLYRVRHFVPNRPRSLFQRLLMEGSFCVLALGPLFRERRFRPDIILYVGAQPSLAMLARCVARFLKRPYVVSINDMAAQAAADVGIVRLPAIAKLLRWFEFSAYRKASGAIVLCEAFKSALLADGYPSAQIRVIPSPVDLESVHPSTEGQRFRVAQGIPLNSFVVLYAGSMGVKQDLETIVETARILGRGSSVLWLLVGEGEQKPQIIQRIANYGLAEQVKLLPFQELTEMAAMFSAADVLVLCQLQSVKETVIPSKLLTYMAAGRPIVAGVHKHSEAARVLREAGGGMLVQPESPLALAEAITRFQTESNRSELGKRNRAYAVANFDGSKIIEAHARFLAEVHSQWNPRTDENTMVPATDKNLVSPK
jgi:colanic acid biosynthesis glycosyl transferase WcaI